MDEEHKEETTENTEDMQDEVFDAGLDFDIPIPVEEQDTVVVEDKFKSAIKFCFIGVGEGGSRIAEMFYKLGYGRVAVVNTAKQDLDGVNLPDSNKLWLGVGGAAKNRRISEDLMRKNYEDIVNLMRNCFGSDFERVMVCATGGGGTGSGGFPVVVQAARDFVEHAKIKKIADKTRVGVILTLPDNSEKDLMPNAYAAVKDLERLVSEQLVSPVVIADNEHLKSMYNGKLGQVRELVNKGIVPLFHSFNRIAVSTTDGAFDKFDPADYSSIMDSGIITYGATQIADTSRAGLEKAFRDNIQRNVLTSGLDLKTSSVAASLLLGRKSDIYDLGSDDLDSAYSRLMTVLGGSTVHRGQYINNHPLAAYTLVGGLGMPKERLDEIARFAGYQDWDD